MDRKTYEIPAENLATLKARIEKLAKRAAKLTKRGVDLGGEPIGVQIIETIRKPDARLTDADGRRPDRIFYVVTVTGPRPVVAGWEFIAALQHIDGAVILRNVPTATVAEGELVAYRAASTDCDHCRTNRRRNDTFVLRGVETRQLRQVGRNCLQDFIGSASPDALAQLAEIMVAAGVAADAAGSEGFGGGSAPLYVSLDEFLPYVVANIRVNGWLGRTAARDRGVSGTATADRAWDVMCPPTAKAREEIERKYPELLPTAEDAAKATAALAWTDQHLHGNGTVLTDYEHNLSVVVTAGVVDGRLGGIGASIVVYWERQIGRQIEREKRAARGATSQYFGTVSKRETFRLTVEKIFDIDGNYGVTHVHLMADANGNVAIWRASSERLDVGCTYDVRATVKRHEEYKGTKQTMLTRCDAVKVEQPNGTEEAA